MNTRSHQKCQRCCIAAALLGAVLFAGCRRPRQLPPPRTPEVSVAAIETQRVVLTRELPGRTSPYRVAEIRPQVSGVLLKRLFEEGTDVQAGQVLYQIDPAPFEAALHNALANLDYAKKNAERARAALEADIANVARQKAVLDLALANRKRFEEAYKDRAVSATRRDQAVTEAQAAEAALRALEAKVESDRKAIAAADAAVKQAKAMVESARINLGYTKVTAPISGRIGPSYVTEGAVVTAYQPQPLATIHQLDPIYVDVPRSTAELLELKRRLKEGRIHFDPQTRLKVKLILENGAPYPLEGTFKFSDVSVDPTTGSVTLRMVFPNPDGVLLPRMFVRAVITEGIKENAILVPQQSVNRTPKGLPYVLIVNNEGKSEMRMLELDRAIGDKWLVNSGLAAGDRVIVEGLQFVRPGMPVKVTPFNPEKAAGRPRSQPEKQQGGSR